MVGERGIVHTFGDHKVLIQVGKGPAAVVGFLPGIVVDYKEG